MQLVGGYKPPINKLEVTLCGWRGYKPPINKLEVTLCGKWGYKPSINNLEVTLCSWRGYKPSINNLEVTLCGWRGYKLSVNRVHSGQGKLEKSGKMRTRFPVSRKSGNIDYSPLVRESQGIGKFFSRKSKFSTQSIIL